MAENRGAAVEIMTKVEVREEAPVESQPEKRRLTSILAADESGTLAGLKIHYKELLKAKHPGFQQR